MKKLATLAALLCGAALSAVEYLPGGFVTPSLSEQALKQNNSKDTFRIRAKRELFVSPDAQGTLSIVIRNAQVGKYTVNTLYELYDLEGRIIAEGILAVNQSTVVKKTGLPQGIYRFAMDSGLNSAVVRSDRGYCCAEATEAQPLEFIYQCPRVFFSVLKDRLKMTVKGEPPVEQCAITIWDAAGKPVFTGNTVGKKKLSVDIPIPKDQEGSVWSMHLSKVEGCGFEDMSFAIVSGAEPVVSLKPDGLVFPMIRLAHQLRKDGGALVGVAISQLLHDEPGLEIDYAFTPDDPRKTAHKGLWKSGMPDMTLGFDIPYDDILVGTLNASARRNGKTAVTASWPITVCEGKLFHEIAWKEHGAPAHVTEQDKARGFQVFQRDEPGDVRPNTRPTADELRTVVKGETSPGLITADFFAVLPTRDWDKAAVAISDLKAPDGAVIPASTVQILTARTWRQRIDWNSAQFINAPELLEKKASAPLKQGVPQQYCIQVKVPAGARPGRYAGTVSINGRPCVPYELTVDDFVLPEYNDMTFGLYADGERWHDNPYTDDEIRREMQMFRDYGMNALMVYPFTGSKIAYDGKTWSVNLDVFRHHQKIYGEVGFPGIQVISLQIIKPVLQKALNALKRPWTQEEYLAGFTAILDEIRRMGIEDKWAPYCLHTVDEPHTPEQVKMTVDTLTFIKKQGFKTFCTCFDNAYLQSDIAPCLDYRCYGNVGFGACSSEEKTRDIRENTAKANAVFWWYGSGCYTNGGLMQDCNVYSNRHMLGVFNWKSKATGAWTWTFLRIKGDVYNDMDANNTGEAKDACICYPIPNSNELIDTLQWEGCREGVYDYRYLRLWDSLVKAAQNQTAKAPMAADSQRKVEAALKAINWTCLQFSVTNAELRRMRALLIAEIKRLK